MTDNEDMPIVQQSESLKLCKMSKGYNWEIRLLSLDIDRLEELNNKMVEKFGVKEVIQNES